MHVILHIILWSLKSKGKGWLVIPFFVGSTIVVFGLAGLMRSWIGETADNTSQHILSGLVLIVTGILVQLFTRNYHVSPEGERIYTEEEGLFMHIGVSFWYGIFIFLGTLVIIGTIIDRFSEA